MSRITVLGLGAMGSRMATNLLKAGHSVTVWNRSEQKTKLLIEQGAAMAKTPFDAVKDAAFVISMVRDDAASRDVWLSEQGAMAGMQREAVAIESSTLTVGWVRVLAKAFQDEDLDFLEAPVVGSRPQAEAAQLIYVAGGSLETLAKARPVLNALGSAVHYAGDYGSAMTIKLVINTLFAVQAAALAELTGLLQKCGLEEASAVEIVTATPVCSPAAKGLSAAMIARKFAPMFPIELVEKDLSYLSAIAEETGAIAPMAVAAKQAFIEAIAQGKGADNITGIAQLYL